ncbi:DUF2079 domain-containing protein [Georgenia halophila]|uniref:DUF2079 domain-containing protein n=1 Tax=Georgenia halophila TaxID=620889 RepID=A0ABP8LCP5_9MICO
MTRAAPRAAARTSGTVGHRFVPWLVAALATAVYVTFAVTQWRLLESPSWDLGIFTQLAKAYADLEAPIVTIKGEGFNLLGDHFHPLLVLLGPLYALHPSGLTLLVAQAVLIGISAVPVTAVARELLGGGRGTALGLAYALGWGLQGAVAAQFHEIAFAVPLLAAALAAYLRGRWWACAAWVAPLVFVKEDLGLTVAALGVVLWWRAGQRRVGSALLAWGLVWVVLAIVVILPALNPGGTWDYYGRLGGEEGRSVLQVLGGFFVPAEKYGTVLLLVLAAGIIGLRSPLVWLWVPTLAWRFLGNVEYYWGWDWHYSAILMPVAAAAFLDVVSGRTGQGHLGRPMVSVSHRWATAGTAVAVATTAVMTVTGPMARLAEPATYAPSPRADGATAAIEAVAEDSTVATDIYLMAYLVPRAQVYWIGNSGGPANPAPDYVVLDTRRRTWPGTDVSDTAELAESRHPGTDYELVLEADGYQVATRVA